MLTQLLRFFRLSEDDSESHKLSIADLQEGDVLVFTASPDCISGLAAELTNSKVSHAGLSYRPNSGQVIHAVIPAVTVDEADEIFKDRTIHVLRRDRIHTPIKRVVDAAENHLNNGTKFAVVNLILVAMMLLSQRMNASWYQRLLTEFLRHVVIVLAEIREAQGDKPMTCSQFVYSCFEEVGGDMPLTLQESIAPTVVPPQGGKTLLDQIIESDPPEAPMLDLQSQVAERATNFWLEQAEKICCKLLKRIKAENAGRDAGESRFLLFQDAGEPIDVELQVVTGQLALMLTHDWGDRTLLSQGAAPGQTRDALLAMRANEALFISPADLLYRIEGLTEVGTIEI